MKFGTHTENEFFERFPYGMLVVQNNLVVHAAGLTHLPVAQDAERMLHDATSDLNLTSDEPCQLVLVDGQQWMDMAREFVGEPPV